MPKTKKIFAYKVVRTEDDGKTFRSAIKRVTRPTLSVSYKIGKITRPVSKTHPFLFVFSKKREAQTFAGSSIRREVCRIFRAEVTNPTFERQGRSITGSLFIPASFPTGTLFVDTVKLVKKVA